MAEKNLPLIVRPAERGSKQDWVNISGQVPPEHALLLDELSRKEGKFRTDLVAEAVELLIAHRAEKK